MKRNFVIIFVIILVMTVIGVALYMFYPKAKTPSNTPKTNIQNELVVKQDKIPIQDDFLDANYETEGKWYGLCQKNSIHSIEDFRKTVSSDPVLKAHFANFNWDNAQMGKLEKSTQVYVYYRKNDTIFRKKTPIFLPAGDGYITDGNVKVRTYCCNSYDTPVTQLDAEPAAKEVQLLDAEPAAGPSEPIITVPPPMAAMTPPSPNTAAPPIIPLPPPVNPPPGYDPPATIPAKTPIGATAGILGTGLVILFGLRRKFKK